MVEKIRVLGYAQGHTADSGVVRPGHLVVLLGPEASVADLVPTVSLCFSSLAAACPPQLCNPSFLATSPCRPKVFEGHSGTLVTLIKKATSDKLPYCL
jgi:hypothetical protein